MKSKIGSKEPENRQNLSFERGLIKEPLIYDNDSRYNKTKDMWASCLEKQHQVKAAFSECGDEESKYQKIMEWGKKNAPFDPSDKISENLVKGCQSTVYLKTEFKDGKVFFGVESDALISAGLAALLVTVYSGETPETILQCPPTFLEDIGIPEALTPNRANGLYSIHLRMKQEALKCLLR